MSEIASVRTVKSAGNDSLIEAKIMSELNGGTMRIEIFGDNIDANYNFSVYCNGSDICKIGCYSTDSCSRLRLYCFGICYVNCNETGGIHCPIAAYGAYSARLPTIFPTTLPSLLPSTLPTPLPTTPTTYPSDYPSFVTLRVNVFSYLAIEWSRRDANSCLFWCD